MTIDDAVGIVQNCWDALGQLKQQYPTQPQTAAVRAAAVVNRTITEIRNELQFVRYRELYERLKLDPLCADIDRAVGEAAITHLLWEMVDRRAALGIETPKMMTGFQYRSHVRRRAS